MRRLGAFLVVAAGVALMVVQCVQASARRTDGFDSLAKALSERYSVKATKIPLMWMVSLCARGATRGGVQGMRVVEFDDFGPVEDRAGFETIVSSKLGEDWSRAVRERESNGGESLVYVRAENDLTELIVIDLKHRELDLVRMEMNPEQLAKWSKEEGKPSVQ